MFGPPRTPLEIRCFQSRYVVRMCAGGLVWFASYFLPIHSRIGGVRSCSAYVFGPMDGFGSSRLTSTSTASSQTVRPRRNQRRSARERHTFGVVFASVWLSSLNFVLCAAASIRCDRVDCSNPLPVVSASRYYACCLLSTRHYIM